VRTLEMGDKTGYVNQGGLSRKVGLIACTGLAQLTRPTQHIFAGVKASLKRLQLDYIDVLQCLFPLFRRVSGLLLTCYTGHRFDPNTPIEETVHSSVCA
jgi:aryl-alcohol dehydrogenase-like predicted oxidoreductase